MKNDTIQLLSECNAGIRMGLDAMDQVMPGIKNRTLRGLLRRSKNEHVRLGRETHRLLNELGEGGASLPPVVKGMSRMKIQMKMAMNRSDQTIAGLMTDGCNTGVKSLSRYLNEYQRAEPRAQAIAKRLIQLESGLSENLRCYL